MSSENKKEDNTAKLHEIKKWWRVFASNWYIFAVILLLSGAIGFYIAYNKVQNEFIAKLQIALKYNEGNKKNYSDYTDEMTGINSPSLVQQTIEELNLDVNYYNKMGDVYSEKTDSLPIAIDLGVATPYLYEQYISFKYLNDNQYQLNYTAGGVAKNISCNFDSTLADSDLKVIINKTNYGKQHAAQLIGKEFYLLFHDKSMLVEKYKSSMSTKLTKDLAIMDVFYTDKNPKKATGFLDALSKNYLNNTIKVQLERNSKTLTGIDKLINGTQVILRQIEDSLRSYSHQTGLLDAKFEDEKHLSILTSLMLDKRKLEMEKVSMIEIERYIAQNQDRAGVPPPSLSDVHDQFVVNAMAKLYDIHVNKKENLQDITDKSFGINKMDNKYDLFKEDLKNYITGAIKSNETKLKYYDNQIAEIEGKNTSGYSKEQLHVLDLERQLKVNEALYSSLLEKKSNILIGQASMPAEYRIVEAARIVKQGPSKDPLGPIGKSVGIGFVVALIFVFLKNLFYEKVETIDDLKQKTDIPILGEMPFVEISKKSKKYVSDIIANPFAQGQLSSIRTNLQFALADSKTKIILVTSHTSSEGKTFNAVGLGAILAKAQKKVLLVDFDLHRPSIAKVLHAKNLDKGMKSIFNNESTISESVSETGIDNLYAIYAEQGLEDASENILKTTTQEIIDFGSANYDFVIIDTPPIGIISDALILMPKVDITLYILNAAKPYKNAIEQIQEVADKKTTNIRLILNKVKAQQLKYYSKDYIAYKYTSRKAS